MAGGGGAARPGGAGESPAAGAAHQLRLKKDRFSCQLCAFVIPFAEHVAGGGGAARSGGAGGAPAAGAAGQLRGGGLAAVHFYGSLLLAPVKNP